MAWQCECGHSAESEDKHYHHVLETHPADIAMRLLSPYQYERYLMALKARRPRMLNPSQLRTREARHYRPLIELALERGGIKPDGITFSVSHRIRQPEQIALRVYIPLSLVDEPDLFIGSVAHEARHAEILKDRSLDALSLREVEEDCEWIAHKAMGWQPPKLGPRRLPQQARLTR